MDENITATEDVVGHGGGGGGESSMTMTSSVNYDGDQQPQSSSSSGSGSSSFDSSSSSRIVRSTGGYDYEFVPTVDSKYICPICMLVLCKPVQTECGHRFCLGCITHWLSQGLKELECPSCKDKLTKNQIFPDNFAKREILNLTLRCPNCKSGCTMLVDLCHIQMHLNVQCQFALCPCPNNCSDILLRKDLNHHISATCPMGLMTCPHCNEQVQRKNEEFHLTSCISLEPCTLCRKKLQRNEMKTHECPLAVVSCVFETFGCQHKCVRHLLPQHVKSVVAEHLQLLANYMTQQQQQHKSSLLTKLEDINRSRVRQSITSSSSQRQDGGGGGERVELCDSDAGFVSDYLVATASSLSLDVKPTTSTTRSVFGSIETVERSYTSPDLSSSNDSKTDAESRTTLADERTLTTMNDLRHELSNLRRLLMQQNDQIKSLETMPNEMIARHCNGSYIWTINNIDDHRQAARNGTMNALHSQGFYTSIYGYKICIRINLNGTEKGVDKYVALFVHFMKGEFDNLLDWPFRGTITLGILDQSKTDTLKQVNYVEVLDANPKLAAFAKPTSNRNHKGFGYIEFAPLSMLDDSRYLRNDVLFVKATVAVSSSQLQA